MNIASIAGNTTAYNAFLKRTADAKTADAPSAPKAKPLPVTPQHSFDPFDKKTWDVKPPTRSTPASGTPADAPSKPKPQYSFNPFDQKTWDVKKPLGANVDTLA